MELLIGLIFVGLVALTWGLIALASQLAARA